MIDCILVFVAFMVGVVVGAMWVANSMGRKRAHGNPYKDPLHVEGSELELRRVIEPLEYGKNKSMAFLLNSKLKLSDGKVYENTILSVNTRIGHAFGPYKDYDVAQMFLKTRMLEELQRIRDFVVVETKGIE